MNPMTNNLIETSMTLAICLTTMSRKVTEGIMVGANKLWKKINIIRSHMGIIIRIDIISQKNRRNSPINKLGIKTKGSGVLKIKIIIPKE